jgi:hypothetical protein
MLPYAQELSEARKQCQALQFTCFTASVYLLYCFTAQELSEARKQCQALLKHDLEVEKATMMLAGASVYLLYCCFTAALLVQKYN